MKKSPVDRKELDATTARILHDALRNFSDKLKQLSSSDANQAALAALRRHMEEKIAAVHELNEAGHKEAQEKRKEAQKKRAHEKHLAAKQAAEAEAKREAEARERQRVRDHELHLEKLAHEARQAEARERQRVEAEQADAQRKHELRMLEAEKAKAGAEKPSVVADLVDVITDVVIPQKGAAKALGKLGGKLLK